jgi:hypothetical protein
VEDEADDGDDPQAAVGGLDPDALPGLENEPVGGEQADHDSERQPDEGENPAVELDEEESVRVSDAPDIGQHRHCPQHGESADRQRQHHAGRQRLLAAEVDTGTGGGSLVAVGSGHHSSISCIGTTSHSPPPRIVAYTSGSVSWHCPAHSACPRGVRTTGPGG